jgi:hypothetical protein
MADNLVAGDLSAIIKNVFYSYRDQGRTMHQAAEEAERRILERLGAESATSGVDPSTIRLGNLVGIHDIIKEASRQAHEIGNRGQAGKALHLAADLGLDYARDWPIVVGVWVAVEMLLTGAALPVEDHVNAS